MQTNEPSDPRNLARLNLSVDTREFPLPSLLGHLRDFPHRERPQRLDVFTPMFSSMAEKNLSVVVTL